MKDSIVLVSRGRDLDFIDDVEKFPGEILALSMDAMRELELRNIEFLNLKDFIEQEAYHDDLRQLSDDFNKLLLVADGIASEIIGLDRLFSGTGFRFFHRISHLRFIQILIDKLEQDYKKIFVCSDLKFGNDSIDKINFENLDISIKGYLGTRGLIRSLIESLDKNKLVIIHVDNHTSSIRSIYGYPISSLFIKLPKILLRLIYKEFKSLKRFSESKKISVWTTELSYDVERLAAEHSNINFKPVRKSLIDFTKIMPKDQTHATEIEDEVLRLIEGFTQRYFRSFSNLFIKIFKGFSNSIIPNIPALRREIRKQLNNSSPLAVFLPSGSSDILEESIIKVAREEKLPVFSFKHTGIESVFFKPQLLDQYREYSQEIDRIQMLHIEDEKSHFIESKEIETIILGNLKERKSMAKDPTDQILFCSGTNNCSSFHSYYLCLSDMERHEWNKKLIKFAQEHEIRLDIKVHPVDWKDSFSYFKKMKGNSDDLIRVIAGGSSEAILHNYGLVILDMVPTQVLSSALASDMNIILFKQNEFLYNDERFEDLEKRVHFVEDQEGLNDCLLAFKEGQLINKSNVAFENKYLTAKYGIKDILKRISSD